MSLPTTNLPLFQIGNQWSDKNGFLTPITAQFVQNLMARIGGTSAPSNTVLGNNVGVASFNTRTGVVTLEGSDVDTALGYTPVSPTGNVATATALQTPRAINGVNFDGTAPITVAAAAGTLTGATLAAGVTASSLTSVGTLTALTVSGTITPSQTNGIVGTTTNNNANAGSVGEFITATSSGVTLSNGVAVNVTSVSLTAGDWDVWGNMYVSPVSGTSISAILCGISSTSGTLPIGASGNLSQTNITFPASNPESLLACMMRFSVSGATTAYLVGSCALSPSTATANGIINARRVR